MRKKNSFFDEDTVEFHADLTPWASAKISSDLAKV